MSDDESAVMDSIKRAGMPVQPEDVANDTGLDIRLIFKIINDLKRKGMITSPRRCYYTLAE